MTGYQLGTLIALIVNIVAIAVLSILKLHVPAEILASVGMLLQAYLPSISARVSINAAKASMRPPPLPRKEG
jgi:predicted anti-sigma-YlaC factor YlaD